MKKILSAIRKYLILFISGAVIYMLIEIAYRGCTHWTMGILGGLSLILIGLIDELFDGDVPLLYQAPAASIIITLLEYYTGYIVNIKLGLNIWDYSNLPLNVDGQVCLLYSVIWMFLGILAVVIDNFIRWKFFNQPWKEIKFV